MKAEKASIVLQMHNSLNKELMQCAQSQCSSSSSLMSLFIMLHWICSSHIQYLLSAIES